MTSKNNTIHLSNNVTLEASVGANQGGGGEGRLGTWGTRPEGDTLRWGMQFNPVHIDNMAGMNQLYFFNYHYVLSLASTKNK